MAIVFLEGKNTIMSAKIRDFIMINELRLKKAWLILMIFVLIFAPPILPKINIIIPVSLILLAVMLAKYRSELLELLQRSGRGVWIVGGVLGAYLLGVLLFSIITTSGYYLADNIITIYRFGLIGCSVVMMLYILIMAKRWGLGQYDLMELIVWSVFIQFLIFVGTLMIPDLKRLLISVMYGNTGEVLFLNKYFLERRFYGFANNLLDMFGYGVGVATALIPTIAFQKKNKWLLLIIPCFLLLAFFNARTGLIIGLLGLIIGMIGAFYFASRKQKKTIGRLLIVGVVAIFAIMSVLKTYQPKTYYWLFHDFNSITKFIATQETKAPKTDTASTLFSDDFWRLPSDLPSLIFGTGHSVYGVKDHPHSDVGYINDIWLMGIVGVLLSMGLFMYILWLFVNNNQRMLFLAIFLGLALVVVQVKGRAIMANAGFVVSLLIISSSSLRSKKSGL